MNMDLFQRRVLPALFISIILMLSVACTSDDAKQSPVAMHDKSPEAKTGAYQPIPADSPDAMRAYRVARDALAAQKPALVLGPVLSAASQVVAGAKIRLYCTYREAAGEPEKVCRVVVYVNLKDEASLYETEYDVSRP